jgi:hypothetical protein
MHRPFQIRKLSDEFGQYDLRLKCVCGHERRTTPHLLARLCGWDAQLEEVAKRLRCSKCGKRTCTAIVAPLVKPRGTDAYREPFVDRSPGARQ